MIDNPGRQHFREAAAVIQQASALRPKIAIVLGSGLSPLADSVQDAASLDYRAIPHFPLSTIPGHAGRLVIGRLEQHPVLIMQGRAHFYEGYSIQQVTLPIRAFRLLEVETLILTNAAGGLNPAFRPGDLMLINDQINMLGLGGVNPLRGPHDPQLGPRFPDMTTAYDRELRGLAKAVAAAQGLHLREGVYVGLSGPSFETPAEIRLLRLLGGDAVGMSTVSECVVARQGGMSVLGISGISNAAIDQIDVDAEASHQEVLDAAQVLVPRMLKLLQGVVRRL